MAVWGFGSMYGGKDEKLGTFIKDKCVCIGWKEDEAPALHQMLKKIKTCDWVYVKSLNKTKGILLVKAIGIVNDDTITDYNDGKGVSVNWLWHSHSPIEINLTPAIYKNNVFNNTLYEEYNLDIQKKLLEAIFPYQSQNK